MDGWQPLVISRTRAAANDRMELDERFREYESQVRSCQA